MLLAEALRAHGVAVRAFPGLPVCGDAIRVSVGPWEAMERFLEALRRVLGAGAGAESGTGTGTCTGSSAGGRG